MDVYTDRTQHRRNCPSILEMHNTEAYTHSTHTSTHAAGLSTQVRDGSWKPPPAASHPRELPAELSLSPQCELVGAHFRSFFRVLHWMLGLLLLACASTHHLECLVPFTLSSLLACLLESGGRSPCWQTRRPVAAPSTSIPVLADAPHPWSLHCNKICL